MEEEKPKKKNKLTLKQARFIEELIADGNGKRAAIAAGYSERTAVKTASKLKNHPVVGEAIAQEYKSLQGRGVYSAIMALEETSRYIEEARAAKQYTAVAKLTEHKAKLTGLLIEKVHLKVEEPVSISAALEAARNRVLSLQPEIIIDVTPEPIKKESKRQPTVEIEDDPGVTKVEVDIFS